MAIVRTGYANYASFPVIGAANIIYVDLSNGNEYTWVTSAYVAYTGTRVGVRVAYKNSAWFTANASILLGKGQIVFLEQTGTYKLGDGVTALSALSFLGGTSGVVSVTGSQVDNTDPLNPVINKEISGLTTNKLTKATSSNAIGDSSISDNGTNVDRDGTGRVYLKGGATSNKGELYIGTEESTLYNKFGGFFSVEGILGSFSKYFQVTNNENKIVHNIKNTFDAPVNNFPQLTSSQIVETDASKNLVSVAKQTGYNLPLGTTAGTVLEGSVVKSYSVVSSYFSNDFTTLASLTDFSITQPNSTWVLTGGFWRLTRADAAAGFSDFANYNTFGSVNSKYWSTSLDFYIKRLDATSYGIGFGLIADCINNTTDNIRVDLYCGTGASKGSLNLRVNGVTTLATTKLTFNVNDKIKLTITRNRNRFTVTAQNMTTIMSIAPVAEFTTITSRFTSTGWSPTQLKPQIYNLGGTYDVIRQTMGSKNWLRPDIIFIGDSITHGMFTDRESLAYPELIGEITGRKTLNFASQSTTTGDWVRATTELTTHTPRYVYIMLGRNDLAGAVSQATILANYTTIINALVAASVDYRIISVLPSNGIAGITALNTALQAAYTTKFIDIYSYLNNSGVIKNEYDSDGTHLWEAGHQEIAKRVIDLETTLQKSIN